MTRLQSGTQKHELGPDENNPTGAKRPLGPVSLLGLLILSHETHLPTLVRQI